MPDFKGLPDALARCRESSCTTGRDDTRISRYGIEPMTYGDLRKALALIDALAKALRGAVEGEERSAKVEANNRGLDPDAWELCCASWAIRARALLAHTGLGGDE